MYWLSIYMAYSVLDIHVEGDRRLRSYFGQSPYKYTFSTVHNHSGEVSLSFLARSNILTVHFCLRPSTATQMHKLRKSALLFKRLTTSSQASLELTERKAKIKTRNRSYAHTTGMQSIPQKTTSHSCYRLWDVGVGEIN